MSRRDKVKLLIDYLQTAMVTGCKSRCASVFVHTKIARVTAAMVTGCKSRCAAQACSTCTGRRECRNGDRL